MAAWYENPILLVPAGGLLTAVVAYALSWMGSRKAKLERTDAAAVLEETLRSNQLRLEAELTALKTNALIEQQKKDAETLKRLDDMARQQSSMATVLDESHAAINSSRTALEAVLQTVRTDLEAAKTKMHADAVAAAERLQAVKDLHTAEMQAKHIEIADLYRQNTALAMASIPTSVVPVAAILPPPPADPAAPIAAAAPPRGIIPPGG